MSEQNKMQVPIQARDGQSLNWLVVNPDGKILAILDSESEAYYYTKNRGHAESAVYFKSDCDYAAAPETKRQRDALLEVLLGCAIFMESWANVPTRPCEVESLAKQSVRDNAVKAFSDAAKLTRAALALCEKDGK
jgi:hypothetical protein